MDEPHQRVQSGKLRKAARPTNQHTDRKTFKERKEVYIGVENASHLEQTTSEEQYLAHLQTPNSLTNLQMDILEDIIVAWKGTKLDDIDNTWRRTWNIGIWNIGKMVSISINMVQPNIANSWVNIPSEHEGIIRELANEYNSYNLERSVCKVQGGSATVQVQGRWALTIADRLINRKLISKQDISIAGLNISQSKIFCWIVLDTGSEYMCSLTRESTEIISRYLPDWCSDIEETSAGGNISIRARNPMITNDASHLQISSSGYLQYNGRRESLKRLYESIHISIHKVMNSIHLKSFLDSLEYKVYS